MGGQLAVISEFNQLAKSADIFSINMSYCKSSGEDGKDKVIFLTEDDAAKPSKVELSDDEPADVPRGLITESGEINWECPCLGGMPSGPCGVEFREAFSCFHYSKEEPKGVECLEQFQKMQDCMKDYPELYDKENEGAGASLSESDSELNDTESTGDIKPDNKESVPDSDASNSSEETRTSENQSDTPSTNMPSSNDTDNSDNSNPTESSEASRSQESEEIATDESSTKEEKDETIKVELEAVV